MRVDVVLGVCAGDALLPRPGSILDVVRVQPDGAVHVHQLHHRAARHLWKKRPKIMQLMSNYP